MLRYEQVIIEGRRISYATEGSGPALVLLHGLGFDYRLWAATAPYLVGHARVIIPDLPGFGRSQALPDGTGPDDMLRVLAAMLTATAAVPCMIAGFGLGGTLALALAARNPERVHSVIAISALGPQSWPETGSGRLAAFLATMPGVLGLGMRLAPRLVAQRYVHAALSTPDSSAEATQLIERVLRDPAQRQSLVKSLAQLRAWQDLMRRFSGVRAPCLIVWGERDRIYGLRAAERLRHAVPGSQLHSFNGAGHLLPLEQPDSLAALMRAFWGFKR